MLTLESIQSVFKLSPKATAILLPDSPVFTIAGVNDAFLEMTNTRREDVLEKGFFDFFPKNPDDTGLRTEKILEAFDHAVRLKKAHQIELHRYDLAAAENEAHDVHYWTLDTFPLLDENGHVKYIIQSSADVTSLVEIQNELEKNKQLAQQRNFDLFNFSPVPMWVYNTETLRFMAANNAAVKDYGYSLEEFLSVTIKVLWPEEDVPGMEELVGTTIKQGLKNKGIVRHIKKSGELIKVEIESRPLPSWGMNTRIILAQDVTEQQRASDLEHLEKEVLELNSRKGIGVRDVLSFYIQGIEALFPQMKCSILQVKNKRLYNWASPSIPQMYLEVTEGLEIGENVGSCGTSAFLKENVIVTDIRTDKRWAGFQDIALKANLHACWSHPIINTDGETMATFATYYDEPKTPEPEELKIIDRAAALLKVILESRQNSQNLKETTLLMEQGQELAHFGNWAWDIENNVVKWSDNLFVIYGLNKRNFKATFEGYLDLLHPDDKDRVYSMIISVLKTKNDIEFEERIIRQDGTVRHLKSWAKLKLDEKGVPVKMIGACLDITESKKTQEELLASEARLRSLVNSQTNYVIRVDPEGRYTYYNNKYDEDFGWIYEKDDLIGMDSVPSVLPYHHERISGISKLCLENPHQVYQVEIDKPNFDGGVKSTLWHFICLTDSAGNPAEIQCIGIDVTDRKKAEDALRMSNERYKYVNKATNDAIYDWDIVFDHMTWGDGFIRIFGYKSEDGERYTLEKWESKVHPDDLKKIQEKLADSLNDIKQSNWSAEYRFRKADETYAIVEENGYIIRDKDGVAIRMIGALRDITERINYIHAIEETNFRLREIAWAQSHLVRGPLARIMGISKLLADNRTDELSKEQLLVYLDTSANELDEVVRDIVNKSCESE
jgi:PAS domain S-box-containing protein